MVANPGNLVPRDASTPCLRTLSAFAWIFVWTFCAPSLTLSKIPRYTFKVKPFQNCAWLFLLIVVLLPCLSFSFMILSMFSALSLTFPKKSSVRRDKNCIRTKLSGYERDVTRRGTYRRFFCGRPGWRSASARPPSGIPSTRSVQPPPDCSATSPSTPRSAARWSAPRCRRTKCGSRGLRTESVTPIRGIK